MEKTCKITNGISYWFLEVDGKTIPFTGHDAAKYFENHYRKLGYEIQTTNEFHCDSCGKKVIGEKFPVTDEQYRVVEALDQCEKCYQKTIS